MDRRFVIVYGDKGLGVHNAGLLFEWAAKTHKSEVTRHVFPGVPAPGGAIIEMFHISSVPDLVSDIAAVMSRTWPISGIVGTRGSSSERQQRRAVISLPCGRPRKRR